MSHKFDVWPKVFANEIAELIWYSSAYKGIKNGSKRIANCEGSKEGSKNGNRPLKSPFQTLKCYRNWKY